MVKSQLLRRMGVELIELPLWVVVPFIIIGFIITIKNK